MNYVVLAADAIGEVMRGERTQLPVLAPAPAGTVIAVKRARNRRPTCLATVTACVPDPDGYMLTVRVAPLEHEPLLLAQDSSRGYTSDTRLAMRDEPEAVYPTALALQWRQHAERRHAKALQETAEQARAARQLLPAEERLRLARQAARRNHLDLRDDFKALRRLLKSERPTEFLLHMTRIERVAYRETSA